MRLPLLRLFIEPTFQGNEVVTAVVLQCASFWALTLKLVQNTNNMEPCHPHSKAPLTSIMEAATYLVFLRRSSDESLENLVGGPSDLAAACFAVLASHGGTTALVKNVHTCDFHVFSVFLHILEPEMMKAAPLKKQPWKSYSTNTLG